MTTKADFNADEWSTIVEAPLLAGMRVVMAGRGGAIRESLAIGRFYAEARQRQGESELLDELVASPPAIGAGRFGSPGDVGTVVDERLRAAVDVLERKAPPAEVEAYRRFVLTLAERAAEAHREGGFLGVGGEQVSDAERMALDEISASLQAGAGRAGAEPSGR